MSIIGHISHTTISRGRWLTDEVTPTQWDTFVRNSGDGTAFHRVAWLEAVTQTLGHEAHALSAWEGSTLIGVLPLVHVRSRLFGNYLVAVPFASYGGPLGTCDAVVMLSAEAVRLAGKLGVSLLEMRARHALQEIPDGLVVSERKVTVTLPLGGGSNAVLGRFPSKLRSQLRRAEKEGVEVEVAPDLAREFHVVYSEHMRDLGSPALPRQFFEQLAERFGDDMLFSVARLDGCPVASGAGFIYGDEFEITWAASLRRYNRLSPNMAMYWRMIAALADRNIGVFNFGRCTVGSGTHRFKHQWGGSDEVLSWYQWRAPGFAVRDATPAPGGKFAVAQAVWTRLPLSVTRMVGPWLASQLP